MRTVLLTGAGFTKNFGGYLAGEMWAHILNQPQLRSHPALHSLLLENLNYEEIYDRVLRERCYSEEEKQAIEAATRAAYASMDQDICEYQRKQQASAVCQNFLSQFEGSQEEKLRGLIFTLNQDLLVERYYIPSSGLARIPGVHHPKWFTGSVTEYDPTKGRIVLPVTEDIEKDKECFLSKSATSLSYIKLHGSYGWKSKDGHDQMIIGTAKSSMIMNEPLLKWFFNIFEDAVNQDEKRLVVVGYGFKDEHINQVIASAIMHSSLRLFVISPMNPLDFKTLLQDSGTPCGKEIWSGLHGYFSGRITEFYEENSVGLTHRGSSFFSALTS